MKSESLWAKVVIFASVLSKLKCYALRGIPKAENNGFSVLQRQISEHFAYLPAMFKIEILREMFKSGELNVKSHWRKSANILSRCSLGLDLVI
jgi:hypothetical protein